MEDNNYTNYIILSNNYNYNNSGIHNYTGLSSNTGIGTEGDQGNGVFLPEWTDEHKRQREDSTYFTFIINGILLNIVAILGLVGNIISMIILSRPQMKSSINYLLIGLARCDTVLILTSIFLFGIPSICEYTRAEFLQSFSEQIYPSLTPYVYPLALTAQTVSVYLTLTVTLERFVAVCHPLKARSLCTYGRARLYVTLIIIFSFLYNLVRFWESSVVEITIPDEEDPSVNRTILSVHASPLRQNSLYITLYVYWLYLIFIYFLPFSSLAVLNAAIYQQVRRANRERQRLSRLQRKEIGLATMLLCVVVVFFICNILALLNNLLECFYDILIDELIKISNLLVTINSSVNFIIYVIFGEKFKRLFLKMFCSHGIWMTLGGRESPDLMTHEDSIMSNGDGRTYSVRSSSVHMCRLHRSGTSIIRNNNINSNIHRSIRISRNSSPAPCVYFPAKKEQDTSDWENDLTTSTSLSHL